MYDLFYSLIAAVVIIQLISPLVFTIIFVMLALYVLHFHQEKVNEFLTGESEYYTPNYSVNIGPENRVNDFDGTNKAMKEAQNTDVKSQDNIDKLLDPYFDASGLLLSATEQMYQGDERVADQMLKLGRRPEESMAIQWKRNDGPWREEYREELDDNEKREWWGENDF